MVDFQHIKSLLNTNTFFNKAKVPLKKYREFIFGLHGSSRYSDVKRAKLGILITEFNGFKSNLTRNSLSELLKRMKILHHIHYIDYSSEGEFEATIKIKMEDQNFVWIICKKNNSLIHMIFWKGGGYTIKNGLIERLIYEQPMERNLIKRVEKNFGNISQRARFI